MEIQKGTGAGESGASKGHSPEVRNAALALLLYALFRWALEVARLPPATPRPLLFLVAAMTAVGGIGLPILAIAALIRAKRAALTPLGYAAAGLLLWFGLLRLGGRPPLPLRALSETLQDLGKILAASGVGMALASALREPNILLPAGAFAAFADFVVVNFGTVKHALSTPKGQAMVQAVSAKLPAVHPWLGPPVTIGPADFLFLGFFLACAARWSMDLRRNAIVLTLVLGVSLLLVQTGWIGPVPALAPMSLAFLVLNWRKFRLTRDEIVSTGVVLVVMGGLFLGYFLFLFPKR